MGVMTIGSCRKCHSTAPVHDHNGEKWCRRCISRWVIERAQAEEENDLPPLPWWAKLGFALFLLYLTVAIYLIAKH